MTNRHLCRLAALLPAIASAVCPVAMALNLTEYSYVRTVETIPQQQEVAALTLDNEIWDHTSGTPPDLRIAESETRPVPHLLRKAGKREKRTIRDPCDARVTDLKELADNQIEIRVSLQDKTPNADVIELTTPLKDFERQLSVWGVHPDGSEEPLVVDTLIYDYSRFADVRHCNVSLPGNRFRNFRIKINGVTDEAQSPLRQITRSYEQGEEKRMTDQSAVTTRPFRMDSVRFFAERQIEAHTVERETVISLKAWKITEDSRRNTTFIEVDTFNAPLTGFVIATDARNFSRKVTVEIPVREGGRESWRQIGSAELSRIAFRSFLREELRIAFPEQRSRQFRVVILNRDNPPLAITDIHGVGPIWQALYLAEPAQHCSLYYGTAQPHLATYDSDPIQRVLEKDYEPVDFKLSAQKNNLLFSTPGFRLSAFFGSRLFFIAAIIVMAGVLGTGLFHAVRHIPPPNEQL